MKLYELINACNTFVKLAKTERTNPDPIGNRVAFKLANLVNLTDSICKSYNDALKKIQESFLKANKFETDASGNRVVYEDGTSRIAPQYMGEYLKEVNVLDMTDLPDDQIKPILAVRFKFSVLASFYSLTGAEWSTIMAFVDDDCDEVDNPAPEAQEPAKDEETGK